MSEMLKVEVLKTFQYDDDKSIVKQWAQESVELALARRYPKVRCAHCHGRVRLHRAHTETSPAPHAEHLSRADSEGCRGGVYFKGEHKKSANPVL